MEYSRFVALDAIDTGLAETIEHVRAHLSEIATADDNPNTLADEVLLEFRYIGKKKLADRGILVTGVLKDSQPVAAYFAPSFDPDEDDQYRWEDEGGYYNGSRET